jgi:hypothetical protein
VSSLIWDVVVCLFTISLTIVGTDVREFLLDGGDANGTNRIVAIDLQQDFIDLGQELYKGPTPGIEFRTANLLDPESTKVDDLKDRVNLLYTGAVFHLFTEEQQRAFAEKIASLLAKSGEVIAFGLHRGSKVAGVREHRWAGIPFVHSPETWKELWTSVLGDDAKNWTINANLRNTWTAAEYFDEEKQVLQWSLWRH